MNNLIAAVVLALSGTSVIAAEPVSAKTTPNAVVAPAADKKEELNCVKKDKKGNCPPAPKSPKPTPKKKAEAK